ncbi:hypothetical protein VTH06DRAFT_7400 [Thermothelomyces fergusii]
MAPVSPLQNISSPARAFLQRAPPTLHPTRTLPHLLNQRQSQTNLDPDSSRSGTLSGGAIAGIVLGSVAGFLLLAWIIRSCANLGAPPGDEAVPGRPWYGGVRGRPAPRRGRGPGGGAGAYAYGYDEECGDGYYDGDYGRGRSPSRSLSRSRYRRHRHHRRDRRCSGGRSRTAGVVPTVPVREVTPVVARSGSRRRSRRRGDYE